MEKVLQILEKNVQWVVMGLGALFLAWAAYAYVVTPPASVRIKNREMQPGQVAPATAAGPAKDLITAINGPGIVFPTTDLVSSWETHMGQPLQVAMGAYWSDSFPSKTLSDLEKGVKSRIHVAVLPVLPKAQPQTPEAGLSVVQVQQPAAPNPNQPAAQQGKDLLWVTAGAVIPGQALGQAMLKPLNGQPIDPTVYNTQLLQVVLERQRAESLGANGAPVFPQGDKGVEEIPPLVIDPSLVLACPTEKSSLDEKAKYLEWGQQHPDLIGQPPFYTVAAGTVWAPPQAPVNQTPNGFTAPGAPAAPVAPVAPRPTAPILPPPMRRTPRASASPTVHAYASNADYAPFDGDRPVSVYPPNAPFRNSLTPRGFEPANNPGNGNPGGAVNPFSVQADIQVWVHDQTVKAGQTYRYRFIYRMKNPVFNVIGMADTQLVNQFALVSPPSDWSVPVTVPETTKFWLASIPGSGSQAKVDVFHWVNGQWAAKKDLVLTPGDVVPGTDLSLVDVRSNGSHTLDRYVLLSSDAGVITQRSAGTDASDPDHQNLLNQLSAGGAAPAPGGFQPPANNGGPFPPIQRPARGRE